MALHDGDGAERRISTEGPGAPDARSADERRADHAAIDRLADELLPALVAKLGASGLGELDVHEGRWRVRLRMPGDGRGARRPGGRPGRAEAHGHAPAGHAPAVHGVPAPTSGGPAHEPAAPPETAEEPTRAIATSPAVGYFRPRGDLAAGARVRAGDRLGTIDVLGVPHELVAPADGIVGASLVAPGDPVEYGQEVVEIELLDRPSAERGGDA